MVRTVLVLLSLSLSLALIGVSASAPTPPSPTVTTFPSLIDHFSTSTQTFQQKILTCTTYWSNTTAGAPVLFYTGNEGPIESFYSNTGSIFSWAQELGALIIFVEHRYYGSSLPYGNESFTRENIRFLTIEQALEDYAVIISSLQVSYGLTGANAVPWIAVGGSYGGVLAAWIRYKYPSLIQGAIAASAPIKYLSPKVDYTYFAAATSDYAGVSQECVDVVRKGYQQLVDLIEDENYVRIQNTWQLCDMPTAETVEHLILWSVNSLLSLAQYDYPYPTNFEAPLGAYPVTQACSILTSTEEPLEFIRLGAAAGLFYNGTGGSLTCFDTKTEFVECADQTGCGLGSDGTAWDYQVCTEFVYLPGTNGKTDMFPVRDFDLQALTYYCQETYGVTPNPTILNTNFGGDDIINIASNIVFSNGALDPYHMGGFTPSEKASSSSLKSGVLSETLGNSITLLLIQDAAHHLDLRFANTLDPESVVEARQIELKNIKLWISQFVPPTTTDDSADSSSSSSSNTDAAGVDDSSSSSSSPSSSILLDNSWSHVSRVSSDSKVSLKLALKHGDAEGLQRKFETTFNPKLSETYLQYPSESELRELVQPKEEVQQLMSNWIVESGLCASENDSSCKVTWSSYKDMVTITTSASRMETFLQDEIHLYTHTRKSGRLAIRSSLSSITHLLPETLVRHVSYTSGVTSWPWLMKAHSNVASTTKVLEIKPNMNLVKVENHEEVRQTYINKLNTNVNAFKKAVASSSNDGNMVGTLPNSALELLHVANFRSGDGNIDLSMMLVYCQLTPTIVLVDYAFDGTIYCTASDGTRIYYQGLRIDVVGVDGSSSPSMTLNSVGLVNTEQGELIVATGTIDVASNYVGYEIRLTPIFSNGNGQTSLYPFPISSMQTVKPSFLRSMVNLPGNLVTQRGSKLGIGALGVTGGTGFYSASDLEQFWSENSLPSSPYTSWVDFSPFKQTNDPTQPDVETQLDIQFGMGLFGSPYGSGTIYHASSSTDNEFDLIIDGVLSDPTPPVTLSFSYGGNEAQSNQGGAAGTIDHTNGRFQALALKGISVFVSSGDSGAYMVQADYATTCGAFSPSYPGSSPYVTSVGASQLKSNAVGICPTSVQSSLEFGSAITGGGGFSTLQTQPDYQRNFVEEWSRNQNCTKPMSNSYNISNRAYPDVVLFGHNYQIVTGGSNTVVDGTSASSPSLAGMFTLLNDLRLSTGQQRLGFLNYVLYQAAANDTRNFIDMTEGSNRCLEVSAFDANANDFQGCCTDGYHACSGWDPVGGLGTPNFEYLSKVFNVTLTGQVENLLNCQSKDDDDDGKKDLKAIIIGCVVGGVVLIALFIWHRRRAARRAKSINQFQHAAASTYAQPPHGQPAYGQSAYSQL